MNESINKAHSQFLVMPTRQTIYAMALKFFLTLWFIGSLVYQMEGFSNWIKIEGMVNFYSSSGNSEQFKKSLGQGHTHTLTHIHSHTYTYTHTHMHVHTYTHTCIPTTWTKARRALAKQACMV